MLKSGTKTAREMARALMLIVGAGALCFGVVIAVPATTPALADDNTLPGSNSGRGGAVGLKLKAQPSAQAGRAQSGLELPSHAMTPFHSETAPSQGECDKTVDMDASSADGVVPIFAQDNDYCTSTDIDTFVGADGKTYTVQGGGDSFAYVQTDVTDPTNPVIVAKLYWIDDAQSATAERSFHTYTFDAKAFRQGTKSYVSLALERIDPLSGGGYCGISIVDITDHQNAFEVAFFSGALSGENWCEVHNTFVLDDDAGEGELLFATSNATWGIQIYDISGTHVAGASPSNPIWLSKYELPCGQIFCLDLLNTFVHDITVVDHSLLPGSLSERRAYSADWDRGLVILNVDDPFNPVVLMGPDNLDPGGAEVTGFAVHHAYPTADGNFVFVQDEVLVSPGDEPVQMWDISDLANPVYVDGLALGVDVPISESHNLEIDYAIDPDRLYVGWYKLGLQAFDFDNQGFIRDGNGVSGVWHQVQSDAVETWEGTWGIRLVLKDGVVFAFQSDRRYGLIVDCIGGLGAATGDTSACPPAAPGSTGPSAGFGYVCSGLVCDFTDTSIDDAAVATWSWDFGDGFSSTLQNPQDKAYASAGTYSVQLTVADAEGLTDGITKSVTVTTGVNTAPTADFIPTTAVEDVATLLDGRISFDPDNDPLTYSWQIIDWPDGRRKDKPKLTDLGDGTATFQAKRTGPHTVALTVSDGTAQDTVNKVIEVGAAPPPPPSPTADFSHSCTDLDCSFTDTSSGPGAINSWSWDFGDSGSSAVENPNHIFGAAGDYTVTLVVTDDLGSSYDPVVKVISVGGGKPKGKPCNPRREVCP